MKIIRNNTYQQQVANANLVKANVRRDIKCGNNRFWNVPTDANSSKDWVEGKKIADTIATAATNPTECQGGTPLFEDDVEVVVVGVTIVVFVLFFFLRYAVMSSHFCRSSFAEASRLQ